MWLSMEDKNKDFFSLSSYTDSLFSSAHITLIIAVSPYVHFFPQRWEQLYPIPMQVSLDFRMLPTCESRQAKLQQWRGRSVELPCPLSYLWVSLHHWCCSPLPPQMSPLESDHFIWPGASGYIHKTYFFRTSATICYGAGLSGITIS